MTYLFKAGGSAGCRQQATIGWNIFFRCWLEIIKVSSSLGHSGSANLMASKFSYLRGNLEGIPVFSLHSLSPQCHSLQKYLSRILIGFYYVDTCIF
jgi:hypothetical protein